MQSFPGSALEVEGQCAGQLSTIDKEAELSRPAIG